jgi:hypothetical protein
MLVGTTATFLVPNHHSFENTAAALLCFPLKALIHDTEVEESSVTGKG